MLVPVCQLRSRSATNTFKPRVDTSAPRLRMASCRPGLMGLLRNEAGDRFDVVGLREHVGNFDGCQTVLTLVDQDGGVARKGRGIARNVNDALRAVVARQR